RAHLKNITEPIRILEVRPEHEPQPANRWVLMFFGKPGRTFGWRLAGAVVVVAALTAGVVVYLTARGPEASQGGGNNKMGSTTTDSGSTTTSDNGVMTMTTGPSNQSPHETLMSYAAAQHWKCSNLTATTPGARAALACQTRYRVDPIVLQMTFFKSEATLRSAYDAELHQTSIAPSSGACTRNSWGGEVEWFHGVGEPGGRAFCHLDEANQRVYVTWTSDAGKKILVIAQLSGLQHTDLYFWWRDVRHDIV